MGHAAMRLSIIPFVFGLAAGIFLLASDESPRTRATTEAAGSENHSNASP
jgi:hypothetical protein